MKNRSGYARLTSQFILRAEDEAVYHLVQNVNFQNARGVGQTTGDKYIVQNAANTVFNHQITSDGVIHGSDTTNTATLQLISPSQASPDLRLDAIFRTTINANSEITTTIEDFDLHCR